MSAALTEAAAAERYAASVAAVVDAAPPLSSDQVALLRAAGLPLAGSRTLSGELVEVAS